MRADDLSQDRLAVPILQGLQLLQQFSNTLIMHVAQDTGIGKEIASAPCAALGSLLLPIVQRVEYRGPELSGLCRGPLCLLGAFWAGCRRALCEAYNQYTAGC